MRNLQNILYAPTFLANAPLGGADRTIRFEQARKFFIANRDLFRRNWRTDTVATDRDFGAGMEAAFRCLCGRWLPLVLAQVDHVATQKDLSGSSAKVQVKDSLSSYLGSPIQKSVMVIFDGSRVVEQIRVTYNVISFDNTGGDTSINGMGVSEVMTVGPDGLVQPDPYSHSAKVTSGCRAFCVRAYSDQSGAGAKTWPMMRMSPRAGQTGAVGQGAVYFEYTEPRIRPGTVVHAINENGRTGLSLAFGDLLKADLTNFQLLCPRCNTSKQDDSFRYVRNSRAGQFFQPLL